jgi:hypothetical protein
MQPQAMNEAERIWLAAIDQTIDQLRRLLKEFVAERMKEAASE